jgi:hypothetical protein
MAAGLSAYRLHHNILRQTVFDKTLFRPPTHLRGYKVKGKRNGEAAGSEKEVRSGFQSFLKAGAPNGVIHRSFKYQT